jgi:hypothetical protein
MEAYNIEQNIKSFSLSVDEPHLSCVRNGMNVTYRAGDQIIVSLTKTPLPGCLVLIKTKTEYRICRFEKNYNNVFLFPPMELSPEHYQEIILGQVIDHVRICQWLGAEI